MVHEYRTPDVYFERTPSERSHRLEKVRVDIAGFLGFAQRGPVGTPVRLQSWEAFIDIFGGFAADCVLPQSVFGFFANGGQTCYVCRVARTSGEDAALAATVEIPDHYGRPTLKVTSRDPGTWGNKLRVKVSPASRPPRTGLRAAIPHGATEASVEVVRGFEPGAVVKVTEGERAEYVVIRTIDRKKIAFEPELKTAYPLGTTLIEAVEVQVHVSSPDSFEIHDNLAFAPGHSRSLVEQVNATSKLIQIADLRTSTPAPFNLPVPDAEHALSSGKDGSGATRPEDWIGWDRGPNDRGGLHAFEVVEELGLLAAPDLCVTFTGKAAVEEPERGLRMQSGARFVDRDPAIARAMKVGASARAALNPAASAGIARGMVVRDEREIEAVQQAIVALCERKKTVFALLDPPPRLDPDQALDWRSRFDSKYAACYYPWLQVQDPLTKRLRLVPPSGHVAGLYSRCESEFGVHKAPANEVLNDVVSLERELTKDVTDALAPHGVNCIRALRGRGIRVWGSRTLSSDKAWEQINVRRLFLMVERSIAEGTEWAVFENNDWRLWKAVEREVSRFLSGLWREGMLLGAIPGEAFWVRCDESNNPRESRDVGEFICDVGIAPVRPAEFIVFRIGQRTEDIITEEPVS